MHINIGQKIIDIIRGKGFNLKRVAMSYLSYKKSLKHISDFSKHKIIFKFDSIEMLSRLINGEYPDTSKLIPQDFSLIIDVNLKDFFNAIDRASLLTSENDKNTIRFETKNDQVIISSNIPEIGYVEETLNIKKNNNEELKIAFSSKYMLDALRAMESEEISLMFNGDVKPIILKNPKNDNLLQLILPIRTY